MRLIITTLTIIPQTKNHPSGYEPDISSIINWLVVL